MHSNIQDWGGHIVMKEFEVFREIRGRNHEQEPSK